MEESVMKKLGFDRLQFQIDIGISEEHLNADNPSASWCHEPIMRLVDTICEVSGGLSYSYIKGMWASEGPDGVVTHERDTTLNMRIVVMPSERDDVYARVRAAISTAVREYRLPCNWIQMGETPLKQHFFQVAASEGASAGATDDVLGVPLKERTWRGKVRRRSSVLLIQAAARGRLARVRGISFAQWRRYRERRAFRVWPAPVWPLQRAAAASAAADPKSSPRRQLSYKEEEAGSALKEEEASFTFKDFIRPATHVEQLARSLRLQPILTVGDEQKLSGPHRAEHANTALVSCCGSYVHRMRALGYVPLAAPVIDFTSLSDVLTPSAACTTTPRSFSLFVTRKGNPRITCMQDLVDKRFESIGINDCAASGAGALVEFANRRQVPWRKAFYSGREGGADDEIVCPLFVKPTGSHFESLHAVLAGKMDVVVVDVLVLIHFRAACADDFERLHVLTPAIGDFLFYPIWLAKAHEGKKAQLLARLRETPPDVLKAMYIKEFRAIEWADFEGNPPIVPDDAPDDELEVIEA